MKKYMDLTNQKFGRWTVVGPRRSKLNKPVYWKCQCECGVFKYVTLTSLRAGSSRSCGCWRKELALKRFTKHGKYKSPLYPIWLGIIQRCTNKNCKNFKYYGGRGIGIWGKWRNDFGAFCSYILENLGPKPNKHSLDRVDTNGWYEPGNLRWSTVSIQQHNKRSHTKSNYKGVYRYGTLRRFRAQIRFKNKITYLGYFDTEQEAAAAYNEAAKKIYGEAASLNSI